MDSVKTTPTGRSRLSLVLLFGIFAAPVVLAWLLFYAFPEWKPSGTTNHGELVEPLRPLPAFQLRPNSGDPIDETFLRGKWTLVYLHSGGCGEDCVQQLYKVRQVRLAQGKNIDRLQRLMFWDSEGVSSAATAELATHFPGLVIVPLEERERRDLHAVFALDELAPQLAGRLYLVDPLGNLMMYYEADTEPRGIVKDLEKLLKWSGLG
jgi:cytochrome oxidase Cu insertion factor (SCO1/SenC/PrrC family)